MNHQSCYKCNERLDPDEIIQLNHSQQDLLNERVGLAVAKRLILQRLSEITNELDFVSKKIEDFYFREREAEMEAELALLEDPEV